MGKLSLSFSPSAGSAVVALGEQLLIASAHGASLNFDREALRETLGRQRV